MAEGGDYDIPTDFIRPQPWRKNNSSAGLVNLGFETDETFRDSWKKRRPTSASDTDIHGSNRKISLKGMNHPGSTAYEMVSGHIKEEDHALEKEDGESGKPQRRDSRRSGTKSSTSSRQEIEVIIVDSPDTDRKMEANQGRKRTVKIEGAEEEDEMVEEEASDKT